MNLFFLIMASFFGAFALGFTKFFGMTYLAAEVYGPASKVWVIQAVGSLMTFGPTLAYVIAGPFAASSRKWKVMFIGASGAALAVALGSGFADRSAIAVWAGLFAVGFSMGIFSAGKMSAAPLQAERGTLSIFAVNAGLSVGFLGGILSGAYFGTLAYEKITDTGALIAGILFLLTAAVALPCRYSNEAPKKFGESLRKLGTETLSLLLRFPLYLLSGPILWGVAGATALAMTAYAETAGLGGAAACSLMSLYAAVGTILGNLVSPPLAKRRFTWALGLSACMTLMVTAMPAVVSLSLHLGVAPSSVYYVMAAYLVVLGFFFGAATNLVDAEYLRLVRTIGKEGEGAALQSAMIAIFSFVIGGVIGISIFYEWLSPVSQFVILGLLSFCAVSGFMVLALMSGEINSLLRFIIRVGAKLALSIRYKIKITGVENLPASPRGLLILPNHPAEIDPVILTLWLWKICAPRPVVTERFFADRFLAPIIRLTGAFAIPDMEAGASRYKTMRIEKTLNEVICALNSGSNVLLYPAGRLSSSGVERLGAASGVCRILKAAPDARVAMVSIRGLRGSSFSKDANGGAAPDFVKSASAGLLAVLRNLIFLTPKRNVTISISVPENFPRDAEPLAINEFLEKFYNGGGEEPLNPVPADYWNRSPARSLAGSGVKPVMSNISNIDPKVFESVQRFFSLKLELAAEKIHPESRLAEDLGIDSLKKAEILILLEDEFFASNVEMAELRTVADVVLAASGALASGESDTSNCTPPKWIEGEERPPVMPPEGATLQEAFLSCCDRMGNSIAIADDMRGVVRWRDLKISVLVLADVFRKLPGERLGIMLPASVGATICTAATLLAGKVPVMMNWTVGRKNLEFAAKVSGIEKVVTSGAFLDKLVIADFGEVESMLVFIEDIKDGIGLPEKLFAAILARRCAAHIVAELGLDKIRPEDPAVILFTSGSESAPKGVPLSHLNIISNLTAAVQEMHFAPNDIIMAILPPFHSFGFTACTMFPLACGIKVAYHPNPTDARRIAEASRKWQATTLIGTPSFVTAILNASGEPVKTLRLIIVGAEKAPESLYRRIESLGNGAQLLEGYGITECSPILTFNRAGEPPEGVGRPFPGVTLLVVNPESHIPLEAGKIGLILARGDNVFSGYLGNKPDPFLDIGGGKWYSTGDLGYLAPSGALILAGRMKRFVKIGGEMVSLPAIEEELSAKWPPGEDGASLAVVAVEKEGMRPELVLFTSADISKDSANEALVGAGFSNLYRMSKVLHLDSIPLLGTGKTDYQTLISNAGK